MSEKPDLRASDADRGRIMDFLGSSFAGGYLDLEEFEERSKAVASAKYRRELEALISDLPVEEVRSAQSAESSLPNATSSSALSSSGLPVSAHSAPPFSASDSASDSPSPYSPSTASSELDDVVRRGKLMNRVDGIIWAVSLAVFFISLFVFEFSNAWVVFPIAAFGSWGARHVIGIDDDDEKLYDSIERRQRQERRQRLHRELDQRGDQNHL